MVEDGPHSQHEQAVGLWRHGARIARGRRTDDWQRDYEAVIVAAVAVLQRYDTMEQLVAAYWRRLQQLLSANNS